MKRIIALIVFSWAACQAAQSSDLTSRTKELINPDPSSMVLLYHDLANLPVPFDKLVDEDTRVTGAAPPDKAARRADVRAEIESGVTAIQGVGLIRIALANATLSDYDPTYEEFVVGALSPSSVVTFDKFGESVVLAFGNAKRANRWQVPAAQSQAIRDKIAYRGSVGIDVVARITGVQPATKGGRIIADVVEYELRDSSRGLTIARVTVPK